MLGLHVFLQARFRVFAAFARIDLRNAVKVEPVKGGLRGFETRVEQDGAKNRF